MSTLCYVSHSKLIIHHNFRFFLALLNDIKHIMYAFWMPDWRVREHYHNFCIKGFKLYIRINHGLWNLLNALGDTLIYFIKTWDLRLSKFSEMSTSTLKFRNYIIFSVKSTEDFPPTEFFSAFLETCFQKGSLIIHFVRSFGCEEKLLI